MSEMKFKKGSRVRFIGHYYTKGRDLFGQEGSVVDPKYGSRIEWLADDPAFLAPSKTWASPPKDLKLIFGPFLEEFLNLCKDF